VNMKKVTTWRPDRANSWVEFCLRWALEAAGVRIHRVVTGGRARLANSRIFESHASGLEEPCTQAPLPRGFYFPFHQFLVVVVVFRVGGVMGTGLIV
jgi:hypothetical protein